MRLRGRTRREGRWRGRRRRCGGLWSWRRGGPLGGGGVWGRGMRCDEREGVWGLTWGKGGGLGGLMGGCNLEGW